ncbi:MAG TPA: PKD domain-containing protein, partial [Tepidisphaeraceae bacterium]|nr:PKD domain-containing protein [Tepidisphaeraceae bacterium]
MRIGIVVCLIAFCAVQARAGWFDEHWQYRRVLNVNWDADDAEGSELATAEFYTAGHAAPGAGDVRIVNETGEIVPSHILDAGPGDLVRLVFALTPHQYKYYAYFGNPNPPPPPKGTGDVTYHCGLLMDMRTWTGGRINSPRAIAAAFERGDEIGQVMIDRPFYGMNPFGAPNQWVAKISGSMSVPVDGDYDFAGGAWNRGALFIDGQPVLFIRGPAQRVKFKTTLTLNRGRHDFVMYDANTGGDGWFSLGWRRPDMSGIQIMDRQPFGIVVRAQPAALEKYHQPLVADFSAEYRAEYETDGAFSQRYRLTANLPAFPGVKVHWDFGDGQQAEGTTVDHVWVTPGVYPIRLTVSTLGNSDTQTTQFYVDRDWEHLDHPMEDDPQEQSDIIAAYDLATVPSSWLPWMAQIHQAAGNQDAEMAVLNQMASREHHDDPDAALKEIESVSADLLAEGKADGVIAMLDAVPEHSDLQPRAAVYEAE